MKFATVMVACAALSMPAVVLADAAPATPSTSAPAAAKVPDRDKIICKVQEETGSLIAKKKVCMTAADWKQKAFASGQWLDHQSATHNGQPDGR